MGCLTLKGVRRHRVQVLGVSHDVGSPAVGCPVIYPTTQGVLRYRLPHSVGCPEDVGVDRGHPAP